MEQRSKHASDSWSVGAKKNEHSASSTLSPVLSSVFILAMQSRHVVGGCCSTHSCSPWVLKCVEPFWELVLFRVATILAGGTCLGITGLSSAMSAALPEGTGTCTNFTWKACLPVLAQYCTDTRSWLLTQLQVSSQA